jgi:hypothetical protein
MDMLDKNDGFRVIAEADFFLLKAIADRLRELNDNVCAKGVEGVVERAERLSRVVDFKLYPKNYRETSF